MSASGSVGGHFEWRYEIVDVALYGTDERGRMRHVEVLTTERLRAAVARLYECWADGLPDGPARTRGGSTARALANIRWAARRRCHCPGAMPRPVNASTTERWLLVRARTG